MMKNAGVGDDLMIGPGRLVPRGRHHFTRRFHHYSSAPPLLYRANLTRPRVPLHSRRRPPTRLHAPPRFRRLVTGNCPGHQGEANIAADEPRAGLTNGATQESSSESHGLPTRKTFKKVELLISST